MLEMGYLEKIKHVMMLCKERAGDGAHLQNILLSATLRFLQDISEKLSYWT